MSRYKLTGNYGTFEVTKVVEAQSENEAFCQTGILEDLEKAGWDTGGGSDGESWVVELLEPKVFLLQVALTKRTTT